MTSNVSLERKAVRARIQSPRSRRPVPDRRRRTPTLPPAQLDRQPRVPAAVDLRLHWSATLDATATALDAAIRAGILSLVECAAAREALNRERAWLETIVWTQLP